MNTYSILECRSCGNVKLVYNGLTLGGKKTSCDCGKESIIIYGLIKDKKFEFRKTRL